MGLKEHETTGSSPGSKSKRRRVLIFEMKTRHPSLAKYLALNASALGPFPLAQCIRVMN